jgi:hypothetical protein
MKTIIEFGKSSFQNNTIIYFYPYPIVYFSYDKTFKNDTKDTPNYKRFCIYFEFLFWYSIIEFKIEKKFA